MRPTLIVPFVLAVAFALPSCKVVETKSEDTTSTSKATNTDGVSPIAKLAADTFDTKLLPLITDNAIDVAELRAAITPGLDAAGAAHGNRGAGLGAAWNFAVKGQGKVTAANLTSRARKVELDTDGDGVMDVVLLLGPVINGTTLRDVAPFYVFGDFRDQIEFAELARAINDLVAPKLALPEGDLTGKMLTFQGAVPLKSVSEAWIVTAVSVSVLP